MNRVRARMTEIKRKRMKINNVITVKDLLTQKKTAL